MGEKPSAADLARACHKIVDAASALMMNVDAMAESVHDEPGAREDARKSVERIVRLARALRAAIEGKPVVGLSSSTPPPP